MSKAIHAASAVAPGITHAKAMNAIAKGVTDPVLGPISIAKVQLCPQHRGRIGTAMLEELMSDYPATEFRAHAAPKLEGAPIAHVYASNLDLHPEWQGALSSLTRQMRSTGYSIHAGLRKESSLEQMIANVQRLQDIMHARVAVEGLYPSGSDPWLMSNWSEYETVAESGIGFALDLSHLAIVAKRHGRRDDLVADLLANPNCVEVHVSDNDAKRDSHEFLSPAQPPWWLPMMDNIHKDADIFYEGILIR